METTQPNMQAKLQLIFRDVLDEPELVVSEELSADQVESWDSLNHVQLMVAIEREFGVRFTTTEIVELKNVGALMTLIQSKGSQATH